MVEDWNTENRPINMKSMMSQMAKLRKLTFINPVLDDRQSGEESREFRQR
jgi:hypothetical protein